MQDKLSKYQNIKFYKNSKISKKNRNNLKFKMNKILKILRGSPLLINLTSTLFNKNKYGDTNFITVQAMAI